MKHLLLILLIASSISVKSQGLQLADLFKIYTSDSATTRQYLKSNDWIFTKDSIGKRNDEVKLFILSMEKSINDSLEILWDPAHKRGLMIVKYRSNSRTIYENIVMELEKMGATIKSMMRREEGTIYSYKIPAYDVFFHLQVKNASPFHFLLMIATPPKKMNSNL